MFVYIPSVLVIIIIVHDNCLNMCFYMYVLKQGTYAKWPMANNVFYPILICLIFQRFLG